MSGPASFGTSPFGTSPFGRAFPAPPVPGALPRLSPNPGPTLLRLYERLPEHYRTADRANGFPLYRWLAGVGSQVGALEQLIGRLDFYTTNDGGAPGETSDLVDPATADPRWLEWLAQLVGVPLDVSLSDPEKRDAIRFASAGWRAGTKRAVADAARTALTGTKFAQVFDHTITTPGDGGAWDVLIMTRGTETPDPARVLRTVIARGAKPAGVVLRHRAYDTAWDTVTGNFPTWNAIEAAGSWNAIQEAGL